VLESGEPVVQVVGGQVVEGGDARTNLGLEVPLGPAPVGGEEAVGAVGRDRDWQDRAAEFVTDCCKGECVGVQACHGGEVFADEPELMAHHRIEREDDDPAAGDAVHFGDAGAPVGPVVRGEGGHGGVEAAGAKWEAFGDPANWGSGPGRPLRHHGGGWLDSDDDSFVRLI
jgi:hypothetical protein